MYTDRPTPTAASGHARRRVGIYGGSFNPIHVGHIALARHFLTAVGLDEVWFVVSPQNPFKVNDALLDDRQRLAIVRKALSAESGMAACDVEFHLPKPSYMWNTLQKLSADHPDCTFTLLIGGDNWTRFARWYHADDILSHYSIAVYPRQDDPIDAATLPPQVQLVAAPLLAVSSTDIRRRIAEGRSIARLVPSSVVHDIEKAYRKVL